jgi:hypothetical protein
MTRAKRLIPHIGAEVVSGAGHLLNYDQAGKIDSSILGFLGQGVGLPHDACDPRIGPDGRA